MEWVASSLALYVGTRSIQSLSALLDCQQSTELTPPPADLNGLVRFAERPNLVSTRVPSRFERAIPVMSKLRPAGQIRPPEMFYPARATLFLI